MKTLSSELKQALKDGTIATFINIEANDGQVYAYTNHDVALTIDGVTYEPVSALQRLTLNLRNNTEVSNQEFASAWVVDIPEEDLQAGKLDSAPIEVFKADWSNPSAGKIPVFSGKLGLLQWTADGFRADVVNSVKELSRGVGVETTAKCRHQLFDTDSSDKIGACNVAKANFTETSSIQTVVNSKLRFEIDTLGKVTGWAVNGVLTWTSGNNNGKSNEIKIHESGTSDIVQLFLPTDYPVQIGDTFEITAGCDKTFATCKNKFNNAENYGGFPHIKAESNFK